MKEPAIRIFADDPQDAPRTGYAQVSKAVTPRTDLSSDAKVVYGAIAGDCYGASLETYASIDRIADLSGLPRRTAQRAITELIEHGIIERRRDHSRPGAPWMTAILISKTGNACIRNQGGASERINGALRQGWRTIAPTLAHHRANAGATPSYIKFEQSLLDFDYTAETSVVVKSAIDLFPEIAYERNRVLALIRSADGEDRGRELVREALDLVRRLRVRYPDQRHRSHPGTFGWVEKAIRNWGGRPIEAIAIENRRAGALPPPVAASPTPELAPPVEPPLAPGDFRRILERETGKVFGVSRAAQKAGRGECSGKNPSQRPAGPATGLAADMTADTVIGAEGDRTLNLRIANETPHEAPRPDANNGRPGDERARGDDSKLRITNAALRPDCLDSPESNLDCSSVQSPFDSGA